MVMEGQAFCFLPLPVKTGLPVHVNGYFEFSSNHRDIWYGHDMDRGGKLRSDWNVCLLEDVVAFAFAQLLLEASRPLGPTPLYYSLRPTGNPSEPWLTLVKRLYASVAELPLLHIAAAGEKWVSPAQALYHDEEFSEAENLATALVAEGLPLVRMVDPVRAILFEYCVSSPRVVLPRTVRDKLRKSGRHGGLMDRNCTLVLLEYCPGDVIDDEAGAVFQGLPLIPLADDGWAVFGRRGKGNVFVCSELERKLFQSTPIKVVDREIPEMILARLESIAHLSSTNLYPVSDVFLLEMLPYLLPADWRNQNEVEWKPEVFTKHPKQEWISLLWEYLQGSCKDLSTFQEWPLLPTTAGLLLRPVAVSRLIKGGVWSSHMESLLLKLSCQFLRADLGIDHSQISYYVHEASASGVLDVISAAALNHLVRLTQMFESVSATKRRELREYQYNRSGTLGIR